MLGVVEPGAFDVEVEEAGWVGDGVWWGRGDGVLWWPWCCGTELGVSKAMGSTEGCAYVKLNRMAKMARNLILPGE